MPEVPYFDPALLDRSQAGRAAWQQAWERAQHVGRPGDLWLLADEAPRPEDAWRARVATARALWAWQQAALAREQLARVLRESPGHPQAMDLLRWFDRDPAPRPAPGLAPPRNVLLGAGHRVDAPGRVPPRFPAERVEAVRGALDAVLDTWAVGPEDLACTAGACGTDLLFAEGCLRRGARLELLLPLPETEFVAVSVSSGADGVAWHQRFLAVKTALDAPPRVMVQAVGPGPAGCNPWQRYNQWLLHIARGRGGDRLSCLFVWDGGAGEGPGGTRDMVERARRHATRMEWIDLRRLAPAGD